MNTVYFLYNTNYMLQRGWGESIMILEMLCWDVTKKKLGITDLEESKNELTENEILRWIYLLTRLLIFKRVTVHAFIYTLLFKNSVLRNCIFSNILRPEIFSENTRYFQTRVQFHKLFAKRKECRKLELQVRSRT